MNRLSAPCQLKLTGFTRENRLQSTDGLRDLITIVCNGSILDFYQFSNISLTLHFEIPSHSLPTFTSVLSSKITLSSQSEAILKSAMPAPANPLIQGTLQLTFIHNEPDLRRHIPAVPG